MDGLTIFGLVCLVFAVIGLLASILLLVFDYRWRHRKLEPLEAATNWDPNKGTPVAF